MSVTHAPRRTKAQKPTGPLKVMHDPLDVEWLRETHLKHIPDLVEFRSFELEGNEDAPDRVFLYAERFPSVFDVTLRTLVCNEKGELV